MKTRTNHGAEISLPVRMKTGFTTYGLINFLFGNCATPPLPSGWSLIQSANDFVRCQDAAGNQYYLDNEFAYPIVVVNGEECIERIKRISLSPEVICLSSPDTSYRPLGTNDCNLHESDEGACWGEVEFIDEVPSSDGSGSVFYACQGHAEFHAWCCGSLTARKYIRSPKI